MSLAILYESQADFRQNYSTIDNILYYRQSDCGSEIFIKKKHGRFYCLFIDFSKAFDSIPVFFHMYVEEQCLTAANTQFNETVSILAITLALGVTVICKD